MLFEPARSQPILRRRALATGLLKFVAALAFALMAYGVINQIAPDIIGLGLATESQDAEDFQAYVESAWIFLPFFLLLMLAARLIARAAFESRGGV